MKTALVAPVLVIDMSALLLPVTVALPVLFAGAGSVSGAPIVAVFTSAPVVVTVAITEIVGMLVKFDESGPGRVHVTVAGPGVGAAGEDEHDQPVPVGVAVSVRPA